MTPPAARSRVRCPVAAANAGALQVTVLDKEGQPVPDAVVVLAPAAPARRSALPMKVTISQEKMRFVPRCRSSAWARRRTFVNNDPWEHHVRASAAGIQSSTRRPAAASSCASTASRGQARKPADARFDKARRRCCSAATCMPR